MGSVNPHLMLPRSWFLVPGFSIVPYLHYKEDFSFTGMSAVKASVKLQNFLAGRRTLGRISHSLQVRLMIIFLSILGGCGLIIKTLSNGVLGNNVSYSVY